jgi:hypothetical protein
LALVSDAICGSGDPFDCGVFKAHDLTMPVLGEGLFHAHWFKIFVVEFELFFGIWLIFGLLPKLTWLVTIGLFSVFSVVSFYKAAILQETSCGCFGAVTVNPWITMIFDLMITGLLLFFLPKKNIFHKKMLSGELTRLRQKNKIIAVVGILCLCTVFLISYFFSANNIN